MRRKTFLTIIVLLLIGIAIYQNKDQTSSLQTIQREEVAEVGFKAPRFTLTSLDKKSFSVPSSKPVVINFWASWCGPCRLEAPTLKKLNEKYQGAIEVYGVNLTGRDSIANVKLFKEEFKLNFPILLDTDNQVASTYKAFAIPTTYFIDKNGIIVNKVSGIVDPKTLEEKFENLLSK